MNFIPVRYLPILVCLLLFSTACSMYQKQIPTGMPLVLENVYVNPDYDHAKVVNVLCLPLTAPPESNISDITIGNIESSLQRNLSKFNYFNVHFAPLSAGPLSDAINLNTNSIDRLKIGALGEKFASQALLKVELAEFRPFPPMVAHIKLALVDAATGERLWACDQVFDMRESAVINGMRCWWNTFSAGGMASERFEVHLLNPQYFCDFAFYSLARTYGDARFNNSRAIEKLQRNEISFFSQFNPFN